MKTVLVILHGDAKGGASLTALRLVDELAALGWRMVFWAPAPSPLYDEIKARRLEGYGSPRPLTGYSLRAMRLDPGIRWRARRALPYARELRYLLRSLKPDLVHANSLYTTADAAVCRASGVPVMFYIHEMLGSSKKARLAPAILHRIGYPVVTDSKAAAEPLRGRSRTARIVHPGVRISGAASRGRGNDGMLVGSIGVIAPRKGADIFVDAARLVGEKDPGVRFQLMGAPDDPLEVEWADRVIEEARRARVEYMPDADVQALLAEWDAFVLPARRDPFPLVVLEAMERGLPIVAARVDGIPEQLGEDAGLLVSPDSPRAVADAILSLRDDPAMADAKGARARARVAERFTIEQQAEGLAAAYQEALNGPRRRPR